jgi:ribulose-phosphate 3-epimerase
MGSIVVKGLRPVSTVPLEVHLMVEDPGRFLDGFAKAGSDTFIVHLEVLPDPRPMIEQIRGMGKKVGLAFNPDMPVDRVEPYLRDIDLALCMTVFPGFGGQAFIPESIDRLKKLRAMVDQHNPACEIEVDGGINAVTIADAAKAGANVFVAGNAVFLAKDGPTAGVKQLEALVKGN